MATQAYLTGNPLCCVTSTNAVLMVRVIEKMRSGNRNDHRVLLMHGGRGEFHQVKIGDTQASIEAG